MSVRRFAALTTVLASGALAALPFYKSPRDRVGEPTAQVEPRSAEPTVTLVSDSQTVPIPRIAVEIPDSASGHTPSPAVREGGIAPLAEWHQPSPIVLASDDTPLPMLPQLPLVQTSHAERSAATIHEPDFGDAASPPMAQLPAAPWQHRLVDGDSLPMLALRYLGDENRAGEIVAMNPDLLRDPALLPVGKTILIPRTDTVARTQ